MPKPSPSEFRDEVPRRIDAPSAQDVFVVKVGDLVADRTNDRWVQTIIAP